MSTFQKRSLMSASPVTASRTVNTQLCHRKGKRTQSEMLEWGCTLLKRPKTISSDLGIVESAPEERRFSIPEAWSSHLPRSKNDRHKYIFKMGTELDSATVDCGGSPGQNMMELSGRASHLRGVRGVGKRTNAILVTESVEYITQYSRVREPSKSKRTSQSSTLDSCAQFSQSTDSTKCTS